MTSVVSVIFGWQLSHNWYVTQSKAAPTFTNCRVTRHLISTRSQLHGSPAETKPDTAIHTHRPNTREAKSIQGHKLYSKVLTIEPHRLHKIQYTPTRCRVKGHRMTTSPRQHGRPAEIKPASTMFRQGSLT